MLRILLIAIVGAVGCSSEPVREDTAPPVQQEQPVSDVVAAPADGDVQKPPPPNEGDEESRGTPVVLVDEGDVRVTSVGSDQVADQYGLERLVADYQMKVDPDLYGGSLRYSMDAPSPIGQPCCLHIEDRRGEHVLRVVSASDPRGDECNGRSESVVELRSRKDGAWVRTWHSRTYSYDSNCHGTRGDWLRFVDARDFTGDGQVETVHAVHQLDQQRFRVYAVEPDGSRLIAEVAAPQPQAETPGYFEEQPRERFAELCPSEQSDVTFARVATDGQTVASGPATDRGVREEVPAAFRKYAIERLLDPDQCAVRFR